MIFLIILLLWFWWQQHVSNKLWRGQQKTGKKTFHWLTDTLVTADHTVVAISVPNNKVKTFHILFSWTCIWFDPRERNEQQVKISNMLYKHVLKDYRRRGFYSSGLFQMTHLYDEANITWDFDLIWGTKHFLNVSYYHIINTSMLMMQYRNRGTIVFSNIKLESTECCTDDMFVYANLKVCIAIVHLEKSLLFHLHKVS